MVSNVMGTGDQVCVYLPHIPVAGAATTMEASLVDTEKIFHGWGDSMQDGAFQQLVTYAQE